jgi:hypothetical protein
VNGRELLVGPKASAALASPKGNAGFAGVTTIDTPRTLSAKGAEVGPPVTAAVILVVPPAAVATPVASPVLALMVAIVGLLEAKVTVFAAGAPEVPSL